MTFISYAQNFEDVMLWRALSHIDHGYYIDVGANDPTIDSVTRLFYEHGWNGINIEPIESHFRDLKELRPHDVNLKCAAGSREGEIDLWECEVRGWATVEKHVVEQHTKDGHQGVFHKVPVITLAKICAEFARGPIHFLKIDVEGFERDVLEGMDFIQFRPWIVLVEATRPNSRVEVHQEWEKLLVSARYTFVYADGLNRYYIAEERSELLDSFRYPPNVFDEFVRIEVLHAEARAQEAAQREADAKAQTRHANARASLSEAETRIAQAEAQTQQALARAAIAEAQTRAAIAEAQTRAAQAEAQSQQALARAAQAEAQTRAAQAEAQSQQALARAAQAEAQSQQALVRTSVLETKLEISAQELHNVHLANHHHWQLATTRHQHIEALLGSTSWRVTAPLRWAGSLLRDPSPQTLKQRTKLLLQHAALYIGRRPLLKNTAVKVLHRFPGVKARLAQTIRQTTIQTNRHQPAESDNMPADVTNLTPRARQIYADLKTAIERCQVGHN